MRESILAQLFGLLSDYGTKHIICSPGSRNAALLQMADLYPEFHKHVVTDERSAAFVGLGIAMVSRSPVALICTSGSALLNYSPALAEAFYQGIPLIAISADRPLEWIDQDDSQTMRQPDALKNVSKGFYDIDAEQSNEDYVWYSNRIINEGLQIALKEKKGPVHFNIRLSGKTFDKFSHSGMTVRKIDVIAPPSRLDRDAIKEMANLAAGKRVMLTAGFLSPDNKLQKAVAEFSTLPNVCIMAETLSNLHLKPECYMVDSALFAMNRNSEESLAPDIVISIGGALISRRLKEFLRRNPPEYHWNVSTASNLVDCFKSLSTQLACEPAAFIASFGKRIRRLQAQMKTEEIRDYKAEWHLKRLECKKEMSGIEWSDLKAMHMILSSMPKEANLLLSNGTAVRYAQIVPHRIPHGVFGNRGISGIEGSTSTAIGAALAYGKTTCLITGDTSFTYDMAAFTSQQALPSLRIVILDNGGGDIFRFIPATRSLDIREHYLCAAKKIPAKELAEAYGWHYVQVTSSEELSRALKSFFKESQSPAIMHVSTGADDKNSKILRNFLDS